MEAATEQAGMVVERLAVVGLVPRAVAAAQAAMPNGFPRALATPVLEGLASAAMRLG